MSKKASLGWLAFLGFPCWFATFIIVSMMLSGPVSAATAQTPKVTWHHKCLANFGFCADFPYVSGSEHGFEYNRFDSGTSLTGKSDAFTSNVYHNRLTGRFCLQLDGVKCRGKGYNQEFYFVDVIRSKYADPWTALTALNEGVKDPVRISVHGNLAARFKGLYGPVGISIYHAGKIYYLEAGVFEGQGPPLYMKRFLRSISFR